MKKRVIVLSLGGSLIIPDKINYQFLHQFKKIARKNYNKYKFAVVCGGGSIARKYINDLKAEGKNIKEQSLAGIRATHMNAEFMMQFFGKEANEKIPKDMKDVKNQLEKNKIVFCGALRYAPDETSDGTAAKLAHFLKSRFINLTNVNGLYSANPKTNKYQQRVSQKICRLASAPKTSILIKKRAGAIKIGNIAKKVICKIAGIKVTT